AIAMLVVAAPASAHGHHHRRHHRIGFQPQQGPAGTIASFDATTGKLTINLTEGETITALVTEDTMIGFSGSWEHQGASSDDQGDQGDWSGDRQRRQFCDWGGSHASTEDLKPGATVEDAVVVLIGGKATFAKIDLAAPQGTEQMQPQSP